MKSYRYPTQGTNVKSAPFHSKLQERKLSDGYPQDIARWRGVPRKIDSAFTSIADGKKAIELLVHLGSGGGEVVKAALS